MAAAEPGGGLENAARMLARGSCEEGLEGVLWCMC